jgi:type I restriction enzyme S subunit
MSKLGALLTLEYGAALPSEVRSGHGFPVYGSNGEVGRHANSLVEGPGIIVGRKGTAGKITWSDQSFWPIDTTYWVKCSPEHLRWIYWVLSWLPLDKLDSSTGIPGLNRNDVYALKVEQVEPTEREKVVEILDAIDTAIRETEAIIAKLKAVKQSLLHDLLTRGIDANGELRPPQSEAPHLYKPSPLGWIPKDWGSLRMAEVSSRVTDGTHQAVTTVPDVEGTIPFLFVSCVRDGEISWKKAASITRHDYAKISKGREPDSGMVLYTAVGSYGHAAQVDEDVEFAFQRHIACVYPDWRVLVPGFMPHVLNSQTYRRYADGIALGNAQKTISLGDLSEFPFICPPKNEQREIVSRLSSVRSSLKNEQACLHKLKLQKLALMDDLLTGRVRVTPLLETADA